MDTGYFCDDVIHFLSSGSLNFGEKKILQIDPKWSETCKKHKTADPSAAADRRLIFPVEYVNTSYHTTFHQNLQFPMNGMLYTILP